LDKKESPLQINGVDIGNGMLLSMKREFYSTKRKITNGIIIVILALMVL